MFEDVHFDFDRYSLRQEATRILDEAIKALQRQPELRIEIEGHTCNIGTADTTSRSASGAPTLCATTSRATASPRTGSGP